MSLEKKSENGAKVLWTFSAIEKLQEIFNYYKETASFKIAIEIVTSIIDKTVLLQSHPKLGQVEELLSYRRNEYRCLIEGNYKIIFWIEEPNIKIATVFDCRQNPQKIKNLRQ